MHFISKPNVASHQNIFSTQSKLCSFSCHCQDTDNKLQVSMITFEDMIDRLEKNSGQTVVSLKEAKMLLKVRRDKKQHRSECRL